MAVEQDKCVDPNDQVINFITNELQPITSQPIIIKINPLYSCNYPIASMTQYILIAQCVADEITTALENNDTITLNKWRAVIQHETAHIRNHDLLWRAALDIATPCILYWAFQKIINCCAHAISVNEKNSIRLYTAIVFYGYAKLANSFFYRYQEQLADNAIKNTPDLLEGMKLFLTEFENITRNNHQHLNEEQYQWTRWFANFSEEHPLNHKRITQLNKRIAALKS